LDRLNNVVAGYGGTVRLRSTDPAAILPADAKLSDGTGVFPVTPMTSGPQVLSAEDRDTLIGSASNLINVRPILTTLNVTSFTVTPTGFTASFSKAFNPALLNLYDANSAGFGTPDVALISAETGLTIPGTLFIDAGQTKITFVATGSVQDSGD